MSGRSGVLLLSWIVRRRLHAHAHAAAGKVLAARLKDDKPGLLFDLCLLYFLFRRVHRLASASLCLRWCYGTWVPLKRYIKVG